MNADIRLADSLARDHVFARDRNACVRCGRDENLEWCHIITRGVRHLRWEPDNAVTLCHGDHAYFTEHPYQFRRWIAERYGPDRWDGLKRRQAEAERRGDKVDVAAVIRGFREYTLSPAEMVQYESGAWLG